MCSVRIAPSEYGPEQAYLESLLQTQPLESLGFRLVADEPAELLIELSASWESEAAFGDILIARTPLVPRSDMLEGRLDTTATACLEGRETLVPLPDLAPPYTALRVDGLALGDEGYPLIRAVGIRLRGTDGKPLTRRLREKLRLLAEALDKAPKPLAQMPETIWLVSGGDLMIDPLALERLLETVPEAIFGGTAEMLERADLALVNLEGVISLRGEKVKKSFNFRFDPRIAPALRDTGIDAVLHANNHVYDYGVDAFLDSLGHLNQAGIGVAGAGLNDEAASEPAVFQRGDTVFRVFGIASFPREMNGWDGLSAAAAPDRPGMLHAGMGGDEQIKARFIQDDPAQTVVNILLFHGGVEWSRKPNAATRELYTDLIRAGADLVIGSHPHVVQGFEWVLGKPVFWSLGNYMFGGKGNTEGPEEGLFIRLGYIGSQLVYLEPFALALTPTRTDIASSEQLERFYARSRIMRE